MRKPDEKEQQAFDKLIYRGLESNGYYAFMDWKAVFHVACQKVTAQRFLRLRRGNPQSNRGS